METFSADYNAFYRHVRELSNKCIGLEKNISEITDATENLDIFWDGDANNAFILAINEDLAIIGAILLKIRKCIVILNTAYREYQETEKVINSIVGGIRL